MNSWQCCTPITVCVLYVLGRDLTRYEHGTTRWHPVSTRYTRGPTRHITVDASTNTVQHGANRACTQHNGVVLKLIIRQTTWSVSKVTISRQMPCTSGFSLVSLVLWSLTVKHWTTKSGSNLDRLSTRLMGDWRSSAYLAYVDQIPQHVQDFCRSKFCSHLPWK